ncbi:hypothetical protein [Sporosarcina pasteurii]|nr:hypothetical protein [Sporosarcina pasteurii]
MRKRMLGLFNLKTMFMKMRKRQLQLAIYYPKQIYEPLARREMKAILTQFNDMFYAAYPEKLHENSQPILDYQPRSHKKQYEVQRAIKLCKSQKVRRKELIKIEEYLNLQYIVEEQIAYYDKVLKKAQVTRQKISTETFTSFFPQLYEERINYLDKIEQSCLNKIRKLDDEKRLCEQAIHDLMHNHQSFWGEASRLIGSMVAESVKHVVNVVDQTFKGK